VRTVQANTFTHNILIQYDPQVTNEQTLLHEVSRLDLNTLNETPEEPPTPHTVRERQGPLIRARIAVRGLDHDPHLPKRIVEHLESKGVRAKVNRLTGRVLVEFLEHDAELDEILAEVSRFELPDLPEEDHPAYPLDPGPLVQSTTRTIGASLGLGLLAIRQLFTIQEPLPGAGVAIQAASIIGIFQGIPPFRYGLRKLLGRTVADLLIHIPGILALTLAGSPLGLALTASESVRLLTEVQARRTAWRRHLERSANAPSEQPDAIIHLETGERATLASLVLEGTGSAIGLDGMPQPVSKGTIIPAGARLYGGPFTLKVQSGQTFDSFIPQPRPAPEAPTLFDRYLQAEGLFSLIYGAATALLTRSFNRVLTSLLLVNGRTAAIGADSAELSAAARVIRAGVTVVGTRPSRTIRLPNFLLLDGTRLLTDKLELNSVLPLSGEDSAEVLALAGAIAGAVGSPWGGIFRTASGMSATDGSFDGKVASASINGIRYSLGHVENWSDLPEATSLRQRGNYVLVLTRERRKKPSGIFAIRPRIAPGVAELVQTCQRHGVELGVLAGGDQLAAQALAHRANIALVESDNAVDAIRARQQYGRLVAFASDQAGASAAFDACDLAIGVIEDRSRLPARADLLAPDLYALASIIETGARRKATIRDSVALSVLANIIGIIWGFRGAPGIENAARAVYITSLTALFDGWLRMRGGQRPGSMTTYLIDPRPERWGQRSVENVLQTLRTTENGLSNAEAAQRIQKAPRTFRRHPMWNALLDQLRSPLIGILAAGAALSLFLGATGDVVIISATIAATTLVNVWQEHKADQVSEALKRIGTSYARILRDDQPVVVPSNEIVPGDILLLAPGDRVAADARVISSQGLEVDEAALTGESLPVRKYSEDGVDASRIVLEGSDVTSGTGRAVVFAIGKQTRMGATTAALSAEEEQQSPLGVRLSQMLKMVLPLSVAGGAIVVISGFLWGQPLPAILATGATIALAGVPEGLPLLAKVGEAGVARRMASRNAVVRRLSAVEALGRVDVACADKTGTMTKGRLVLSMVAGNDSEAKLPGELSPDLRRVLLAAALASPHPDSPGASAHPTDVSVLQAAQEAGLGEDIRVERSAEQSFDPVRSFHASIAQGRLCVKGAPEALLPRCSSMVHSGQTQALDEEARQKLLDSSQQLAQQGLRVLMVAEGPSTTSLDDPEGLTALGFVGISDPLRPTVRAAVHRCHEAGVKVIMITGDHPTTARTIAREAGLLNNGGQVVTAAELAELQNGELTARLEHTVVVARATPLDKLRIIEALQRNGHTVAMTGDGVNDAPALRLADIGVAMGKSGTEVARQTADVVITDDDFSTLVEGFVEGRSFWRNIRRALGLLLGGNLGELGLVVGASILGGGTPLTARQILAVNAITDILPALAVALQQPEHRKLSGLRREGAYALNKPLRNEILRRGTATTIPSLVNYLIMLGAGTLPEARAVAFASIVSTQLAQTLEAGRTEGSLTRSVLAAVTGSVGVLAAAFTIPPLRNFLHLVVPSPLGWALIGIGAVSAVAINHLLAVPFWENLTLPTLLPAPEEQPVEALPG
jgi:calcium-translocating P-type ATPase